MTAVELLDKLSEFAERVRGMLWADGWHDLDEIADRLDEELSELDRMRCRLPEEHGEIADGGCYDGMVHPVDDEDYEACRWVREHGGLDAVRGRLGERKLLVDRCRAYEDALDMMADSLGVERSSDKIVQARRVRKAVKSLDARPAPEVLDADGVEIRVGDTVYDMVGDKHEVKGFGKQGDVLLEFRNDESLGWRPSNFTHRAPVLASDGRPLREGETVWHKQTGRAATVKGFDRMLGEPCAVIDFTGIEQRASGTLLTHEQPDSWERLKEDATLSVERYRERFGLKKRDGMTWSQLVRADLMRRAKKLADRGQRRPHA